MGESRNIDELKRLVITALDKSGALAELRSSVKLQVSRAISEDPQVPLVHQKNERMAALMATERGQLLTELVVEFLRFYDLKDTLAMMTVEAALPRLRPSETELAAQCNCSYSQEMSVIEQYLARHTNELHFAPHHAMRHNQFDADVPIQTPEPLIADSPSQPAIDESPLVIPQRQTIDEFSPTSPGNTSVEIDMQRMRNISQEIERISLGSAALGPTADSPRYDQDEFEPESPQVSKKKSASLTMKRSGLKSFDDDDVVIESRESLKDLGEAPASKFPIDQNDKFEPVERST